jgi:hypothetical protein
MLWPLPVLDGMPTPALLGRKCLVVVRWECFVPEGKMELPGSWVERLLRFVEEEDIEVIVEPEDEVVFVCEESKGPRVKRLDVVRARFCSRLWAHGQYFWCYGKWRMCEIRTWP